MACTALLISQPDSEITHKIKVLTTPLKEGLRAEWFSCDDEWKPSGFLHENFQDKAEMDFHMEIRRGARKAKTFVIGESTNPELNVYLDEEEKQSLGE